MQRQSVSLKHHTFHRDIMEMTWGSSLEGEVNYLLTKRGVVLGNRTFISF